MSRTASLPHVSSSGLPPIDTCGSESLTAAPRENGVFRSAEAMKVASDRSSGVIAVPGKLPISNWPISRRSDGGTKSF